MSAQPQNPPASDLVNVEIDGVKLQGAKGAMIIQVADKAGIQIPRFCYHEKLAIAANCRMCLVDVEKSPKPMPACATPIMEGMKVSTRSKRALDAQRNVMEFLLVNHPLDCPICDQGGECELQDMAMGYGRSVSRFAERKRVVPDEDLGPLVATDMTRCIHCTRCVRFMDDIAGTTELGGMFRGEHLEIGTYIGRSLRSELSGNVIDLCPVGALTNKVFRFRARPWELIARDGIGYHDALGSNLYLHLRRGEVMRVVPRDNEAINEAWLSDRDRYSHQGLYHAERLLSPKIKVDGQWQDASWEAALQRSAQLLKGAVEQHGPDQLATLAASNLSCEEYYLLQLLTRGLGSAHIDHRLRQLDFSDDAVRGVPSLGAPLAEVERAKAILLVGGHPRFDQPILGHRIRKAWKNGARIYGVHSHASDAHYSYTAQLLANANDFAQRLLAVARAVALATGKPLPSEWAGTAEQPLAKDIAAGLSAAGAAARVMLGDAAIRHPQAAVLRSLARWIADAVGGVYDEVADGANGAGAWLMGAVPVRGPGFAATRPGAAARALLETPRRTYLLYGAEAPQDFALGAQADRALRGAACVIAFSAYFTPALAEQAQVVLPLALCPETEGTYINAETKPQRVNAAARAPGESRAGWRILRVLGELLGVPGFDFTDLAQLQARIDEVLAGVGRAADAVNHVVAVPASATSGLSVSASWPIYQSDAVVRRAPALQSTVLAASPLLLLNPEDALALGVGQSAQLEIGGRHYAAAASADVPKGALLVPQGLPETAELPLTGQAIAIDKVIHG